MKGLLLLVGIASAQDQKSDKDRGGVLDVLQGVLRGERQVRGNVVAVHDTDVVVRGDDARTYVVNTSGIDQSGTQGLKPGQPVSVTARSAGQNGVLVASALKTESSPTKNFQTIEGTVESVDGTQTLPLDLRQVVGRAPTLQPNTPATLTVEQDRGTLTAVWIEPRTSQTGAASSTSSTSSTSSASPSSTPSTISAPSTSAPSASPSTSSVASAGYQRVHGYVQSVASGSLALKTDDGQTLTVDTTGASGSSITPGDVVSITGKMDEQGRLRAELIQKDR